MSRRGSISVEASIGIFAFLFVTVILFSNIYAYIVFGISYEKSAIYYLENNYDYISDEDINDYLNSKYVKKDGNAFKSFNIKEEFNFDSSFEDSSDNMVYVTVTGNKYHRLTCKHARLSSKLITIDEAKEKYSACSKCVR